MRGNSVQSPSVLRRSGGADSVGARLNDSDVTMQQAIDTLQIEKNVSGVLVAGETVIDVFPLNAKGSLRVIVGGVENPFTVVSGTELKISAPYLEDENYIVTASTGSKETVVRPHNYLIQYPSIMLDDSGGEALISPINIYSNTRGYSTDFDPRVLKPVRTNIYYVDPWRDTSSDSNDGLTRATAFKTLAHAMGLVGDNEIILEPGDYPYIYGTQETIVDRGMTIRCDVGVARLTNKALPRHWTAYEGFAGVYVCDNELTGEDFGLVKSDLRFYFNPSRGTTSIGGLKVPFRETLSNVTVDGLVGWYVGGSVTVMRLPNNIPPTHENLEIWYAKENMRFICNDLAPHTVYTENLELWRGYTNSMQVELSHEDSVFVGINNKYMRALTDDSFGANFYGMCVNWGCEASEGYRDGFNYHTNVTEGADGKSTVYEINCKSSFNGLQGTANNGSTFHNSVRGVRLNCVHNNSDNRNIQDINDSMSFNVGVSILHGGQDGFADLVCGHDSVVSPTYMYLLGCDVGEIVVNPNARLYVGPDNFYSSVNVVGSGRLINFKP